MFHHLQVTGVVARNVLDAIGELLAGGEQLLEVAETARHRIAPRVDDFGIRQNEMNQTNVPGVVGVLVDEARFTGPIAARIGKIAVAEAFEILPAELCEDAWVSRFAAVGVDIAALQGPDQAGNFRQFHGALDLGMRGQYLFEQGRSGARQADDEDRCSALAADAAPLREALGDALERYRR
jgi:hypothetical protein